MLVTLIMFTTYDLYSQNQISSGSKNSDNIYEEKIKSDRLPVDSLNKKGRKFVSFLVNSLYTTTSSNEVEEREEANFSTDKRYDRFENFPIDTIIIVRNKIGEDIKDRAKLERIASNITNALHATTKERTVKRNLIIKEGDLFDPEKIILAEYTLRQSGYFTDVNIVPTINADSTLTLTVITQDKLTLGAGIDYQKKQDSRMMIYDNNLFGRGGKLDIVEYFNGELFDPYVAMGADYTFNNLFGKFIDFKTGVAYGEQQRYKIEVQLDKEFILPGDFAFGSLYLKKRMLNEYKILDILYLTHEQHSHLWMGKSFDWGKGVNTPYITAGVYKDEYIDEPGSTQYTNPAFHNQELAIGSLGVYRENFYKTNMVYGFGYTENIPYGYKVELTGGYRWGEFDSYIYNAISVSYGNRFFGGYLNIDGEIGAYYRNKDQYYRYIRNLNLYYISNLYPLRRGYNLRLFFKSSYLSGEHMLGGESDRVWFTSDYRVRGIKANYTYGTTRLYNSLEAVVFTPWHALGFRFAMFGYSDYGSLGLFNNPFTNDNFSTIGVGIRVRNENLVFSTFEFRLSAAVKNDSPISQYWIEATSPSKVRVDRFIPNQPAVINYE